MNLVTLLLMVTLLTVIFLLTLLFFRHNKLKKDFKNYNPNPTFGPGQYNYGRNNPYKLEKEMRLERIRYILSLKWTWYWLSKQAIKERKIRRNFNKSFKVSVELRKKKKLKDYLNNQI